MADNKNENSFVGGGMAGVESATPTPAKKPTGRAPSFPVRERGAVVTGVTTKSVIYAPDNREPLDPSAEVLGRDYFARPLELHLEAGWENGRGIERRFKPGDELWLVMRITVTLDDAYMTRANDPENIAALQKHLPTAPASSKLGDRTFLESFQYRVKVIEHVEGATITVGLCPLYVVEVVSEGPAQGFRFLAYPSDLMDDENLDGYGIDRIRRRKKDGFPVPDGFTMKAKAI